jgi:hypothetical protein
MEVHSIIDDSAALGNTKADLSVALLLADSDIIDTWTDLGRFNGFHVFRCTECLQIGERMVEFLRRKMPPKQGKKKKKKKAGRQTVCPVPLWTSE